MSRNGLMHALTAVAVVIGLSTPGPGAHADSDTALEAESLQLSSGAGAVFKASAASGGKALLIWSNATATGEVVTSAMSRVVVRARADECDGPAAMEVSVDGTPVIQTTVSSAGWTNYATDVALASGTHRLSVSFTNDRKTKTCDRNLRVDLITFENTHEPPVSAEHMVEAEQMSLSSGSGQSFSDADARGGKALLTWSNANASTVTHTPYTGRIVVRARGDQCDGAPRMSVSVDGTTVLSAEVPTTTWANHTADVSLAAGRRTVAVAFTNDNVTKTCDRNLRVDLITFVSEDVVLYVDPDSAAREQADAWRDTRPSDAQLMDKIASQPQAFWLGAWSGDVRETASAIVTAAGDHIPVLVSYKIPDRDCAGGHSAGGTDSASAYRAWIRDLADGIGSHRAIVVLEPDAVAQLDCLSAADQQGRLELLRDAVAVLKSRPGTSVYLDAGHSGWLDASEAADMLRDAGGMEADGFSLNVSNFGHTPDAVAYGKAVSAELEGAHFVVDTSRNGLGPDPDGDWCNPSGRALGERPTIDTGDALVDAFLWVKRPGESDGTCNSGPSAGQWWADYALGLADRASW